jgi:thiol:disulfide interchange protein
MATKTKVNNMSEEDEKKVTQWFLEARSDRSLSKRSMEERYPLVYAMTDSNQQEPQQDEQLKEDKTIAATDSSAATPLSEVTEPTSMEVTQQNCDEDTTGEKPVVKAVAEFSDPIPSSESPDSPSMQEESVSLLDGNDDKQPPVHRVSSKQRRLSFEEYRSVYLPVPKIENRMPVFISASLRDDLDKIARRLGGKRMTASGILENLVRHHLITYGDELKEWYKL